MQSVMAYWIVIGVISSNPGLAIGYCLPTACLEEMYTSIGTMLWHLIGVCIVLSLLSLKQLL